MKPYDKYEGGILDEEDTRLRRQDIEYWIKNDSDMDDAKFAFIDYFIRKELIQNRHGIESIVEKIVDYRDEKNMKALATVLQGLFFKDSEAARFLLWPSVVQRFFELQGNDPDSYTYLYVGSAHAQCKTVARAVIFVSRSPYASAQSLIAGSKKYFGYVVPISFSDGSGVQEPLAKLLLFDRSSVDGFRVNTFSDSFLTEGHKSLKCIPAIPVDELAKHVINDVRHERDRELADAMRAENRERLVELLKGEKKRPGFVEVEIDDQETDKFENLRDEYLIW